jgi:hypothetical protein
MNILHATTTPDLLTRRREILDSSDRADCASVKLVQSKPTVRKLI